MTDRALLRPPPWYDLAALHAARAGGSLHVADGVAIALAWVARADPALALELSAGREPVAHDPVLHAGFRASRRALLAHCQHLWDVAPAALLRARAAPAPGGRGGRYAVPTLGGHLAVAPAAAALLAGATRLAAARGRTRPYLLALRGSTVLAALAAEPAGADADAWASALPPIPASSRGAS